jgi:hypothetical protein
MTSAERDNWDAPFDMPENYIQITLVDGTRIGEKDWDEVDEVAAKGQVLSIDALGSSVYRSAISKPFKMHVHPLASPFRQSPDSRFEAHVLTRMQAIKNRWEGIRLWGVDHLTLVQIEAYLEKVEERMRAEIEEERMRAEITKENDGGQKTKEPNTSSREGKDA